MFQRGIALGTDFPCVVLGHLGNVLPLSARILPHSAPTRDINQICTDLLMRYKLRVYPKWSVTRLTPHPVCIVPRRVVMQVVEVASRIQLERKCVRRQKEGKPITSLYTLAKHCHYGALHDEMIRHPIVVGIRNTALSENMHLQPDLDFEKAKRKPSRCVKRKPSNRSNPC